MAIKRPKAELYKLSDPHAAAPLVRKQEPRVLPIGYHACFIVDAKGTAHVQAIEGCFRLPDAIREAQRWLRNLRHEVPRARLYGIAHGPDMVWVTRPRI